MNLGWGQIGVYYYFPLSLEAYADTVPQSFHPLFLSLNTTMELM